MEQACNGCNCCNTVLSCAHPERLWQAPALQALSHILLRVARGLAGHVDQALHADLVFHHVAGVAGWPASAALGTSASL